VRAILLLIVLLNLPAFGETCLIIKHASVSHQLWVSGANWQYVEGDFPHGMKWKSNITDRNVRKIKELGGKVVIVPEKYSTAELQDARNQCSISQPAASSNSPATAAKAESDQSQK